MTGLSANKALAAYGKKFSRQCGLSTDGISFVFDGNVIGCIIKGAKNKMKIRKKIFSGSVLIFTLLALLLVLAVAAGIASVSVIERKSSGTTGKSNQAFQVADGGTEIVLKKIHDDPSVTLSSLAQSLGAACVDGKIIDVSVLGTDKLFSLSFYSDEEAVAAISDCGAQASAARKIKSVGSYKDTVRAVEVAVAVEMVDNGCSVCDVAGESTKACDLKINGENVCADGDGCVLRAVMTDSSSVRDLNSVYLFQISGGQWRSDKGSGINGDSSATSIVTADQGAIYDDTSGTETSSDSVTGKNTGSGKTFHAIICD